MRAFHVSWTSACRDRCVASCHLLSPMCELRSWNLAVGAPMDCLSTCASCFRFSPTAVGVRGACATAPRTAARTRFHHHGVSSGASRAEHIFRLVPSEVSRARTLPSVLTASERRRSMPPSVTSRPLWPPVGRLSCDPVWRSWIPTGRNDHARISRCESDYPLPTVVSAAPEPRRCA